MDYHPSRMMNRVNRACPLIIVCLLNVPKPMLECDIDQSYFHIISGVNPDRRVVMFEFEALTCQTEIQNGLWLGEFLLVDEVTCKRT